VVGEGPKASSRSATCGWSRQASAASNSALSATGAALVMRSVDAAHAVDGDLFDQQVIDLERATTLLGCGGVRFQLHRFVLGHRPPFLVASAHCARCPRRRVSPLSLAHVPGADVGRARRVAGRPGRMRGAASRGTRGSLREWPRTRRPAPSA